MAAELANNAIEISPEEVKAKITNLTTKFRKCNSCIGPSGGSPSNWPLYDRINRIIGSQPIHNLTGVVEDSIIDIHVSQSGIIDLTNITSDGKSSLSLQSQSLTPSLNDMLPTLSSADKPSSSRGAKNKKID
ncbi:hypothetical protein DOY81_008939 [Sarcophaga bullata]|nr:hypothetical protein DOY81_008939 [Sarcophaga bullata]